MKTTIYLTRHGQTEWNIEKRLQGRGNSPLTKSGIERAEELAERLKTLPIDIIYTSPLERAAQTAHLLRGEKDIPIIVHEDLVEMSFGIYEGRKIDELAKENPDWHIHRIMEGDLKQCAPEGETLQNVRKRTARMMDSIIKKHEGETILIVTHGITLKALMHYFKDDEINKEVMGQATLTKIEVRQDKVHIVYKNDDQHFTVKNKQLGW